MCDRIREDDERTQQMKSNVNLNKCLEVNKVLEKCLQENGRDFRKCKNEVNELRNCFQKNREAVDMNNMNK
jgi:hypothetical protein